jgi:hypothetical protein
MIFSENRYPLFRIMLWWYGEFWKVWWVMMGVPL